MTFPADLTALNWNNTLLWRHKFAKRGRNPLRKPQWRASLQKTAKAFCSPITSLPGTLPLCNNFPASTNKNGTCPPMCNTQSRWAKGSRLMLNYRASYQQEENDKETYDFQEATQDYDLFNENLSKYIFQ